jgi:RNA polymerase sigma-70 factor (ECF subfamily)
MDLGEVYTRYGAWIRRKVRRHLPDAWEDALQETFVRLQPALERLRESREEAVRALVSRTVRSVCIDEVRRRVLRDGTVAPDEIEDPASSLEPEGHAADLERITVRWKALGERERRILVLRFRDDLSFREIAELLDVPQGSVAGWYSRALAHLREELA